MSTVLVGVSLVLVAASGLTVLLTRSPLAQAVVLSVHGLVLTVMFTVMGAPDVALSQLTVGAAVVPLMVLLALAKTRTDGASAPGADGTADTAKAGTGQDSR